jgi:hypothetical protein
MSDEIRALKFEGGVDADGHILEDQNLWENYLEARYKPKALRLKKDRAGLEYMEIEGLSFEVPVRRDVRRTLRDGRDPNGPQRG